MLYIKQILKKVLGFSFSFLPQIKRGVKRGLTIFVFHEISDHPSEFLSQQDICVSIETFHRQVSWIKTNFKVIHPKMLLSNNPLPEQAALITFDDGFLGTFENGLPILEKLGLPSIVFLNMRNILEPRPTLSALACFLDLHVPVFGEFAKEFRLERPYHLTLSPFLLEQFLLRYGPYDSASVLEYQGKFSNLDVLKAWDGKDLVSFGNHLFEHWNARVLSPNEFNCQYKKNVEALNSFKSTINLFAFTNGQPISCFSGRDLGLLADLAPGKVFAAIGGVNIDTSQFLLGRLSLSDRDSDEYSLWFQVGRSLLKNRLNISKIMKC